MLVFIFNEKHISKKQLLSSKVTLKFLYNLRYLGFTCLERVKVYVCSSKIPTVGFVDKEGAMHACAQAGSSAFSGLKHYPGSMDNRYLSDEERKAIIAVEDFCNKHNLESETIDVATMGFLTKIKLKAKGLMNFPSIAFKEKVFHGVPTEEALQELLE